MSFNWATPKAFANRLRGLLEWRAEREPLGRKSNGREQTAGLSALLSVGRRGRACRGEGLAGPDRQTAQESAA